MLPKIKVKRFLVAEALICATVVLSYYAWQHVGREPAACPQDIVDRLVNLQPKGTVNFQINLMRTGEMPHDFDVNSYFTVLDSLHMEKGVVLDWVYQMRGRLGGTPVLYTRRKDDCAYTNFEHYVDVSTNATFSEDGKTLTADASFFFGYLGHIHVEDSAKGYFQFVVLMLQGDRFLLYWHEYYNDIRIVCSRRGWQELMERRKDDRIDPLFLVAAQQADFAPSVRMGRNVVEVSVVAFHMFGGLKRHSFVISRTYPHSVIKHSELTILDHCPSFQY